MHGRTASAASEAYDPLRKLSVHRSSWSYRPCIRPAREPLSRSRASRRLSTEPRQAASAGGHRHGGGAERGTVDGRDAAGTPIQTLKKSLRMRSGNATRR